MPKEMPMMQVDSLMNIFIESGRDGLVKELCIFDEEPKLNNIMFEMVDNLEYVFMGQMSASAFGLQMGRLNKRFYSVICDVALDKFNEGDISGDRLKDCLEELQEKKASFDNDENHQS